MTNKKIMILYATAGAGHKKAAEALYESARNLSIQCEFIDIVDYMSAFSKWSCVKGYIILITHLSWLWAVLYFLSDSKFLSLLNMNLRKFLNLVNCRLLIELIKKERPDVVISTHFVAGEIVSYVKEKLGLKIKLINCVTDFGVHNFWIASGTDIYCCAGESTKRSLIEKGVEESRIRVTGIPVNEKFINPQDKDMIYQEFNLNKGLFTVLIMTGGIGAGPIEEIVDSIKDEVQLLVVCGNNKQLYDKLSQKKYTNVRVYGFVNYIEKLMAVSNLIITKSGGLSVTESLTMGLPMILFFIIPGQEMINAKTLERHEAGIIAESPDKIKELVLKFKNNPDFYACYKKNALSLSKPHACQDIISLID